MELPYGENFIILTSAVFVWSTRLTDGRVIAYTRYGIYCVARKNMPVLSWILTSCAELFTDISELLTDAW